MANAQKKVIVRCFNGAILPGYLPVGAFVRQETAGPQLDLLDLAGRVASLPLEDVKIVSYVRDFNLSDTTNPERLARRTFLARPRTEGLWLRLTLRTGEQLEGLAATDLTLLTSILEDNGLFLTPPDTRSNTQRLFIPRLAITELQLIAVITSPSKKKPVQAEEPASLQETLFASLPPSSRPN
ncbi:MAG TPA: hypothetical protein VGC07_10485 [Granulicella sp.]